MLNNEIRDFTFHEFKTDSDNFVKDMSKLLSLGIYSKDVKDESGNVIKPAAASLEYNWQIVSPAPNFTLLTRTVTDMKELSAKEYELITNDQIKRITNKAVIKCTTLSKDGADNKASLTGVQKSAAELYLQLYMPKYLCDTEIEDPFIQEDGVTIPLCINPKNAKKEAKVRNYHWCLVRMFDNPNADFSGPLENEVDLVTGELKQFNSASSEWTKLSWFTDFEEKFLSDIIPSTAPTADKVLRLPVNSSLTNKTKIRVMANFHPNRVALSVVGNPNVDYGDNRYLISSCYIGAIDNFEGSKADIEGNFGMYTTSSTVASIPKETNEPTSTFTGLDEDEEGKKLTADKKWMIYDQTPPKNVMTNSPEPQMKAFIDLGLLEPMMIANTTEGKTLGVQTLTHRYKKREIPTDVEKQIEGGRTTIVDSSVKVTLGSLKAVTEGNELFFKAVYEYGPNLAGAATGATINKIVEFEIPMTDLRTTMLPVTTEVVKKDGTLMEEIVVKIDKDALYKKAYKYIEVELATRGELAALIPGAQTTQVIRFEGRYINKATYNSSWNRYDYYYTNIPDHKIWLGFDEQGVTRKVVNKSERDKYGNLVAVNYPKTFGQHTANGTTDFAMYRTDSADFWQSHFLMFSSTEQFMKKHMYGKSVYTNEYFADRIKVTHSAEGVRGVLSGLIVIDAESLFAFDELIVNKDFNKDLEKPEETYIYLPITAPFCPFANSPNERNGLGLLKELKYSEHNDNAKCESALIKLAEQYVDSFYYTNGKEEIVLADKAHNGLAVTWASSNEAIIKTTV